MSAEPRAEAPSRVSRIDTTVEERLLAVPAVHHARVSDIARNARQPAMMPSMAARNVRTGRV